MLASRCWSTINFSAFQVRILRHRSGSGTTLRISRSFDILTPWNTLAPIGAATWRSPKHTPSNTGLVNQGLVWAKRANGSRAGIAARGKVRGGLRLLAGCDSSLLEVLIGLQLLTVNISPLETVDRRASRRYQAYQYRVAGDEPQSSGEHGPK